MTSTGLLAGPECFLCSWQLPAPRGKMPVSDPQLEGRSDGACQGQKCLSHPSAFPGLPFWSASIVLAAGASRNLTSEHLHLDRAHCPAVGVHLLVLTYVCACVASQPELAPGAETPVCISRLLPVRVHSAGREGPFSAQLGSTTLQAAIPLVPCPVFRGEEEETYLPWVSGQHCNLFLSWTPGGSARPRQPFWFCAPLE